MRRATLLTAVVPTMVAGGALAQDSTTDGFQTTGHGAEGLAGKLPSVGGAWRIPA